MFARGLIELAISLSFLCGALLTYFLFLEQLISDVQSENGEGMGSFL